MENQIEIKNPPINRRASYDARKKSIGYINIFKLKTKKNIKDLLSLYSRNSLCCFSKKNKFRILLINIIENIWFTRIMTITILLSSVTMILYTYSSSICDQITDINLKSECLSSYKEDIDRDILLDKIFIFFNVIFFIEMIFKMFAKGLILHKRSYFRDCWNILDCFITIYYIIGLFIPNIDRTTCIRVVRLLRVLTNLHRIQGIKRLINSIIISLPTLGSVFLFIGFVFILFATVGTQLFSGSFLNRCRTPPVQVFRGNKTVYVSQPYLNNLCSGDNSSGLFKCPNPLHCVNFYDIPEYFNLTQYNITIDEFDISDENLINNIWFNYGISNFDNIFNCLINVLCFMTYQNWAQVMSILLDTKSTIVCRVYFLLIVTVGGFFIMKLILAAQNEALINIRRKEKEEKMLEIEKNKEDEFSPKNDISENKDMVSILNFIEKPKLEKNEHNVEINKLNEYKIEQDILLTNIKNNPLLNVHKHNINNFLKKVDINPKIEKVKRQMSNKSNKIKKNSFEDVISESFGEKNQKNNEAITFYCNQNIMMVENLQFKHGCKNLRLKFNELSKSSQSLDTYLNFHLKNFDPHQIIEKISNSNNNSLLERNLNRILSTNSLNKFKSFISSKLDKVKDITVEKIKYLILDEYSNTPHYILFNLFVYSLTFLNIIYACRISYPMSDQISQDIQFMNVLCSSVFMMEILFKLMVLGIKGFFIDKLNVMDFIIVNLGIIEIITVRLSSDPKDDANSSFASFRSLRFIRLIKLFNKGFIQRFVNFLIISLRDLLNYCFLLGFFIFIFSIFGRELFANRIYLYNSRDKYGFQYQSKISPRENFDSIFNSFLTVFILFIGDNWPNIMFQYGKDHLNSSYVFFILIIVFGNIMLFNIFLSIMMSNYDTEYAEDLLKLQENDKVKHNLEKLTKTFKGYMKKVTGIYNKCLDCCDKNSPEPKKTQSLTRGVTTTLSLRRGGLTPAGSIVGKNEEELIIKGSNLELNLEYERIKDLMPITKRSLFIFSKTNKFRIFCWKVITISNIFEYYLILNICISLLILSLDVPVLSDINMKKILFYLDIITTFAFFLEMCLKIVAYGFLFNGQYSYLRFGFNVIDFISVWISVSYIIVNSYSLLDSNNNVQSKSSTAQKIFRIVKIMRIVRIFKIVQRSKSLQATLIAFYVSLKQMLSIILVSSTFILMFSIIGVSQFGGAFYRCNFNKIPDIFMYEIKTKWDCLDYGGEWINPYPNFDNIYGSFLLLFEMMTTEGWTFYMYSAMDASNINEQPIRNQRSHSAIFFILYMIFAYFFLLNLTISILSDNFKKEKERIENKDFNPIQKEYFIIYKNLFSVELPKNTKKVNKITKILLNILDSIYFDVIITMCIISNLIILMMNWPGKDERTKGFISYMNSLFTYVYITEACLKIYVFRFTYFSIGWNILDFILVILSLIQLIISQLLTNFNSLFDSSFFRAIRVARILRILKKAVSLNRIFNLFLNSIPGFINVSILYFLILFVYSVIGMSMFSFIKPQEIIGEKWNFKDFLSSFILLVRVTSGEGWNTLMHECMKERSNDYFCKYYEEMTDEEIDNGNIGCGSIMAIPYFVSFIIFSVMMCLQFFSVVIVSTIGDTYVINLEEVKKAQLNKFKNKWAYYDKECTGFIFMDSFQKFLYDVGYPLGLSTMKTSDYLKIISLLDIYTYENKKYIFFYDVLTELAKYYMIHNQIKNELGEGKLFRSEVEIVEEKSLFFESLNNE